MLRIYPFIHTLRKIAPLVRDIAKHDPDLARQLRRSASSMALNTAEGSGRKAETFGPLGSTYETRANLDVAEVWSYVEIDAQLRDDLDRIAATLFRLIE